jgi:hypothetical protein
MRSVKFFMTVYLLFSYLCVFPGRITSTLFLKPAQAFDGNTATSIEQFATDTPFVFEDKERWLLNQLETKSYPVDPVANIPWSGGFSGVDDIEGAFNNARSAENSQLGINIPILSLPTQEKWSSMSDGEKALWLVNQERTDRGIHPLHGIETNVTSVAQYYAQFLLENNAWGHYEDGKSPWDRLNSNVAIGDCHDFLNVAENLACFVTSGDDIPLPVERAVYNWMYDDSSSAWGHRHAILWFPYNDNSGTSGMEGFLGIGRANGGPYQGPFSTPWNYAEIIVMNVFDPCITWDYDLLPEAPASIDYPYNDPDGSFTVSWSTVSDAAGYQLERSTDLSFTSAVTCYSGQSTSYSASGLINGTYFYRVKAYNDSGSSNWKTGHAIIVGTPRMPWIPLLLDE